MLYVFSNAKGVQIAWNAMHPQDRPLRTGFVRETLLARRPR